MYLILIAVVVFIIVWEIAWWLAGVKPILPGKLKAELNSSQSEHPLLIDVRTGFEYDLFHIRGAVHHPTLLRKPQDLPDGYYDKPIVIICMSGHRSAVVAYLLKKQGCKNVSYLVWGMLSWIASGGTTTRNKEVNRAGQWKH